MTDDKNDDTQEEVTDNSSNEDSGRQKRPSAWSKFKQKIGNLFARKKSSKNESLTEVQGVENRDINLNEEGSDAPPPPPSFNGPIDFEGQLGDTEGEQTESEFTINQMDISDLKRKLAEDSGGPSFTEENEDEDQEGPPQVLKFPNQFSKNESASNPDKTGEFRVNPNGDTGVPPVPDEPEELQTPREPTRPIDLSKLNYVNDLDERDRRESTSPHQLETLRVEVPNFEGNQQIPGWRRQLNKIGPLFKDFLTKLKPLKEEFFRRYGKSLNLDPQDFEWDNIIAFLFGARSRKKINTIFVALAFIGGSYSLGKVLAYLIKGPEKRIKSGTFMAQGSNERPFDFKAITDANIFNIKRTPGESLELGAGKKPRESDKPCFEASVASPLPIKLLNTIVLQDSVKSIAAVSIRGNAVPTEVRENEKIEAMAKVGKIDRLRVIFKNLKSGECEYIDNMDKTASSSPITFVDEATGKRLMDQARPDAIKNVGNKFTIKKSYRDQMLQDIGGILTQARAIPIKNPDGSMSFKMTEIQPGSIYSHLNIQDGDLITRINGKEIANINEIMNMFGRIKDIDHLSISVNRNGSDTELEYNFE